MLDIDYIRISKFTELTGWTESAIRSKIQKGEWLEGRQWVKSPDSHLLISLQGYKQWVEMTALGKRQHQATKSISPIRGNHAANGSSSSPAPLIANG